MFYIVLFHCVRCHPHTLRGISHPCQRSIMSHSFARLFLRNFYKLKSKKNLRQTIRVFLLPELPSKNHYGTHLSKCPGFQKFNFFPKNSHYIKNNGTSQKKHEHTVSPSTPQEPNQEPNQEPLIPEVPRFFFKPHICLGSSR